MKSEAIAMRLEEHEEDSELKALLDLIKNKQTGLDKKLRALIVVAVATGE